MKKALKIIGIGLAGLFILVVVIALIPGGSDKLKETNNSLKQTNQELEQKIQKETKPTAPLSEKEQIQQLVLSAMDYSEDNKIKSVDVVNQVDGGWGVFVEYEADNGGTRVQRKNRIDDQMAHIYNALFSSKYNIKQSTVDAYMLVPLETSNKVMPVYKTIMKRSFLGKTSFYDNSPEERDKQLRYLWNVSIYNEEYLSRT